MTLRAVTFDFWGTLYQARFDGISREPRTDILQRYLARQGYDFSREQLRAALDESFQRANEIWLSEQRTADAPERVGWILKALGVTLSRDTLAEMTKELEEASLAEKITLVPGAAETLHELANHYALGLISDTGMTPGRVLRQLMARDGILDLFGHCTFSDETGRAKPHPRQFLDTLSQLGVPPEEAVHVGDLAATDIVGARSVGMRAVLFTGVTQGQDPSQADAVIASFDELPLILRQLSQAISVPDPWSSL
ncbi:MAG: HAD family hydrolase [Anaerolineae bacterium]|nr:HAD family hydrolase [Anaerolineae bacterium]MDW8098709.1 HAD family hydrolase [Anaerolineae bacterium]